MSVTYEQKNMYRMEPAPPEMKLNDYIVEYKSTGDSYWIACFFHCFEPKLNGKAYQICDHYWQLHRFEDVKQEMVAALFEKINDYDPTVGTSLLQFAWHDVINAVHKYIRQNGGVYALPENRYKYLRRVTAIYYRDRKLSSEDRIRAVVEHTGLPAEKVRRFVAEGEQFRFSESLNVDAANSLNEYELAKRMASNYSSPEKIVPRAMFYDAIVEAIEKLRHRDRKLLEDYKGIACLYCGRVRRETPKADIADELQLRDEQSVENNYRRIIKGLRDELEKQGWI